MAKEVYRIDISVFFNDQYSREIKQAEREISRFEKSVERTEKRLARTSKSRWRITLEAVDRASRTISNVGNFAERTARKSYRLTIGVVDLATRPLRAIGSLATSTLGLLGAGVGVAGGIVWPTKLADDLEVTQVGFETMLKSAEKAQKFMEQVREFAKDTPFGQREVVELARSLLVRGFRENEIIPMLERIGDVAAAMGTGAEGIDRIIYALGQMRALGKVSAEEMNQLTDAGVMAWHYLAQGMGKSIKEVRKLSEEGKISADEAIKHILKGMEEYSGMMRKVSDRTIRGLLGQITDVFEADIFTKWGEGIQKVAVPALKEIRDWFDKNEQVTQAWSKAMEEAGSAATQFVVDGVRWVQREMSALVNSKEWKEASGPFEKISLAFRRITSPLRKWWDETGKQEVEDIASKIGRGIGGGLGAFITSAFSTEVTSDGGNIFVQAGASAGKKFIKGFLEELHVGAIVKKLLGLFWDIQPSFLGGKTDSLFGSIAALMFDAWLISRIKNLLSGPFSLGKTIAQKGWSIGKNVAGWARDAKTGGLTGNLRGSPLSPVDPRRPSIPTWMTLPGRIFGKMKNIFRWPWRREGPPATGFMVGRFPGLNVMSLLSLVGTPQEQLPFAVGGTLGGIVGSALGATLGSIIPGFGTVIGGMAGGFLGSKIGEKIGGLAGQSDILSALDDLKNRVSSKFVEIKESAVAGLQGLPGLVAEQFGYMVGFVGEKMSQLPGLVGSWAAQTVSSIASWFSNLPGSVSTWWSGVYSSISSWAQLAYNSVTTWIGGIPNAIRSAFERAQAIWGNIRTWVSEKVEQLRSRFSAGQSQGQKSARKYAQGGLISRPHLGLVGEDGPEMIIPLSPSRRSRGLELWMRAADYLGVRQYADGGIVSPITPVEPVAHNKGQSIMIEVGGITVQISPEKVDTQNIKDIAKDIAEEVADEVARKLIEAVSNTPIVST